MNNTKNKMNNTDSEYFRLLNLVLENGKLKKNRTEIDTFGVFGAQARFDLSDGFPAITTKKLYFNSVAHELLWFLSGSANIKYLVDNNVHIWDDNCYDKYLKKKGLKWIQHNGQPFSKEWFIAAIKSNDPAALKEASLGEGTYGGMWREFPYGYDSPDGEEIRYVDQISKVIESLKNNPDSRRHIVSAWHPYWVDNCALPPCHVMFQFHTEELTLEERKSLNKDYHPDYHTFKDWNMALDKLGIPKRRLNCQLYQRSADLFLGVPFNIASYSLLTCMIAHVTNMIPGEFIHTFGDLHLYENHLDQVKEQLKREPRELPDLYLRSQVQNIFDFKFDDIHLEDYNPHPPIKAKMAV